MHTNRKQTMITKTLTLWSRRFTPAQGNHWVAERKVQESDAAAWLAVFQKDEPGVLFLVNAPRPAK